MRAFKRERERERAIERDTSVAVRDRSLCGRNVEPASVQSVRDGSAAEVAWVQTRIMTYWRPSLTFVPLTAVIQQDRTGVCICVYMLWYIWWGLQG